MRRRWPLLVLATFLLLVLGIAVGRHTTGPEARPPVTVTVTAPESGDAGPESEESQTPQASASARTPEGAVALLVFSSDIVRGSGTTWSTPVTIPGLVPQLTCGAMSSARIVTVISYVAFVSVFSCIHAFPARPNSVPLRTKRRHFDTTKVVQFL